MNKRVRKRARCVPAVALLAILWMLAPFLAACGATAEPTAAPEATAAPAPTAGAQMPTEAPGAPEPTEPVKVTVVIVETVEVEKTIIQTVEVEKEVEVTRVVTAAAPAPVPTAAPPTPLSPGVVVQNELERLASGLITYNPPAEMTVDHAVRVEVRISMDTAVALTEGLKGPGTPVVESIPVGYFMRVRLVGESFAIVALNSDEQIVPAQGFAEWAWDVTPTESGTRNLCLVVTALVKASTAEGTKDLPIIERQIHVKVNPGYMLRSFFRDNRPWIFTAVLLPLVAAGGRWLWQRQQGRTQTEDPDAGGDASKA